MGAVIQQQRALRVVNPVHPVLAVIRQYGTGSRTRAVRPELGFQGFLCQRLLLAHADLLHQVLLLSGPLQLPEPQCAAQRDNTQHQQMIADALHRPGSSGAVGLM